MGTRMRTGTRMQAADNRRDEVAPMCGDSVPNETILLASVDLSVLC